MTLLVDVCDYSLRQCSISRKPVLPVEVQLHKSQNDADDDDVLEWSADDVLKCAQQMMTLKKKINERAKENIDAKQAKDKEYYDRKHADPKVKQRYNSFMSILNHAIT